MGGVLYHKPASQCHVQTGFQCECNAVLILPYTERR